MEGVVPVKTTRLTSWRWLFNGSAVVGGVNFTVVIDAKPYRGVYNVTVYANGTKIYERKMYGSIFMFDRGRPNATFIYLTYQGRPYALTLAVVSGGGGGWLSWALNITLTPVYCQVEVRGPGVVPFFDYYSGQGWAGRTNVTVIAFYSDGAYYGSPGFTIKVLVNGTTAHTEVAPSLPERVTFTYGGEDYTITLQAPPTPELDAQITPPLTPDYNLTVWLPNGTQVNLTIYHVNTTVEVGGATVWVTGHVSRAGTHLYVIVYGVTPAGYTATLEGVNATVTLYYVEALHVHAEYMSPEGTLIPDGTQLTILIQPLNLTIPIQS